MVLVIKIKNEVKIMKEKKESKIIEILEHENSHNDTIRIRVRKKYRKTKDRKDFIGYRVYLDYYNHGIRKTVTLDKSLHLDGTAKSFTTDDEKVRKIVAIRNRKQDEILDKKTGFNFQNVYVDFYTFFEENMKSNYSSVLKSFKTFMRNKNIAVKDIDRELCKKYAKYLEERYKPNSAHSYFSTFKTMLNAAIKDEIIEKNPANHIVIKQEDTNREFLTADEIKILLKTTKTDNDICSGFLFSCFTGIRLSDVRRLKFSDFDGEFIIFKQKKTGGILRLKLLPDAIRIIDQQKECCKNQYIFNLMSTATVERYLMQWTKDAGLSKHITYHASRHSFSILCISSGMDIYSICKLLGQKNIKTTMIYLRFLDEKRDRELEKFPSFQL